MIDFQTLFTEWGHEYDQRFLSAKEISWLIHTGGFKGSNFEIEGIYLYVSLDGIEKHYVPISEDVAMNLVGHCRNYGTKLGTDAKMSVYLDSENSLIFEPLPEFNPDATVEQLKEVIV